MTRIDGESSIFARDEGPSPGSHWRGERRSPSARLSLTALWLLTCGYFSLVGWALSLAHALDSTGYTVAVAGLLLGLLALSRRPGIEWRRALIPPKLRWRFRRLLPLVYVLSAFCVWLGGILYLPNNYDALTYRIPRVLHWLAEHHWHWVTTNNLRINIGGTGFEWLMAPVFALTGSDRPLFLINAVSYLALPGLWFGFLTQLGVRRRVAWSWMWLMPTGYCFVLQAGGIGNDMMSALFCLASISFTLKSRRSGRLSDLFLGALSAALLTATKTTNLPLLLPWALAAMTAGRSVRFKPILACGLLVICLSASFLPIALLNLRHTGSWAGDSSDRYRVRIHNPVFGVLGNTIQMIAGNAEPPIIPVAKSWNRVVGRQLETGIGQKLMQNFPCFRLTCNELAQEERAGLGLGMTGLLVVSVLAVLRYRQATTNSGAIKLGLLVCTGGWVSLVAYMAAMGSEATARLLAPYYPLLFAFFLLSPRQESLVRHRWWKIVASLAALSALPALILSPSRPLWPAERVCNLLLLKFPHNPSIERLATVYSVYGSRAEGLAPLLQRIPRDVTEIGFIAEDDDLEAPLWRPFGIRRVTSLNPGNLASALGRRISIIVATPSAVERLFGCSFTEWLRTAHLKMIGSQRWQNYASQPARTWFVLGVGSDKVQ